MYIHNDNLMVTLRQQHISQMKDALEQEYANRLVHLKFHNVLQFQKFYDNAKRSLSSNTFSIQFLEWFYDQVCSYGSRGKKPYREPLMKWLPLAIRFPDIYEHASTFKEVPYEKPPKANVFGDLEHFLIHAQSFSEYFDLDFSFVFTEFTLNKKTLTMFQWQLLFQLFGKPKMRKSLSEHFDLDLKLIPLMPKAYASHLSTVDFGDLEERYSSLEIVAKINRHKKALLMTLKQCVGLDMWLDEKNDLKRNHLENFKREALARWIDELSNKIDKINTEERDLLNELVHSFGLSSRMLYKF